MRFLTRSDASPALLRVLPAGWILLLAIITVSCGETYRPIAQPVLGPQPNPSALHFVELVSANGSSEGGAVSRIDVAGDANMGIFTTGFAPLHAALGSSNSKLFVANAGDDFLTVNNVSSPTVVIGTVSLPASPSLSISQVSQSGATAVYTYSGGTSVFAVGDTVVVTGCSTAGLNGIFRVTGAAANTFSVPNTNVPASNPEAETSAQAKVPNAIFLHTADSSNVYAAGYGTNSLYVVNATTNVLTNTVPVGIKPVALVELPNGQKLYTADQGSNSVSVVNLPSDVLGPTISIGASPVWVSARADNQRVYALDSGGTISAINTLPDAVVDNSQSAGPGANFMFYDKVRNRLYVTNPRSASSGLSIFDVSGTGVARLFGSPISVPTAPASPCTSPLQPTAVNVLGDGSRAYVASYQADPGMVCTQLSVVDAGTGTVIKTIPLTQAADTSAGTGNGCGALRFRVFVTSSGGGTNTNFKVYVSQCDAGSVAVIDSYPANGNPADFFAGVSIVAPLSSFPPTAVSISGASQASATTTYSYTPVTGPALQPGMRILISGMADPNNNGGFVVTGVPTPSTFTVANPSGVTSTSTQSGSGNVMPLENPVFVLAGP